VRHHTRNGHQRSRPVETRSSLAVYGPDGPHAELYRAPEISLDGADNNDLDQHTKSHDDHATIQQMASLSGLVYQQRRASAAEELGIGVGQLDKLVKAEKASVVKPLFTHWEVAPASEPVNPEPLISKIVDRIRSHVVMPSDGALVVALWVALTWVHERAAVHSPILLVTSPEPNSGKSTLLGVISFLVRRSLQSVGITAAPLYRAIEKWQPTIIVDEGDTAFIDNEDLRAAVNSGWTRGQGVIRCDSETNDPRMFSTFCPKAIGMKGRKLPETTMSRAVVIEMARKKAGEQARDFRHIDDSNFAELRSMLARFAGDNAERLREAEPALPKGFENRRAANWQLLFAIADLAGIELARAARAAAEKVSGDALASSAGTDALRDIKKAFESKGNPESILSRLLVDLLTVDPEGRWCEWGRDRKPITQKQLAGLLREFRIISTTIHPPGEAHGKGYRRSDFDEAWQRYLEPEIALVPASWGSEACKGASTDETGTTRDFRSVQKESPHGSKNSNLSNSHAGLDAWTLRKPGNGVRVHCDHENGAGDFPDSLRRCAQCNAPGDARGPVMAHDDHLWLHRECWRFWLKEHSQ
jgi:putative DNA primase/helicase